MLMTNKENILQKIAKTFEQAGVESVDYSMNKKDIFAVFKTGGAFASIFYSSTAQIKCIWIESLETHPASRERGHGTRILNTVFGIADNLNLPVMLEAVPLSHKDDNDVRMTLNELVAWYTKRGFFLTKKNDEYCDMIRPLRDRVAT